MQTDRSTSSLGVDSPSTPTPSSLLPFLSQKVGWPLPPFVLIALKMIFNGVQVQVGVR